MTAPLLATASQSPLWYLTRGSGIVALILFTGSMVVGIASLGRWTSPGWPRFATAGLHRSLSLLAVAFLGIHIITAELDTFAPVGWLTVVVPFASTYRPLWLGFGTLAFDLLLAVTITSVLRTRLGHRTWRVVHWAAYAAWPAAVVHGLGTGTDPRLGWVQFVVAICVAAVVIAVAWRLMHGWPTRPALRAASAFAGVGLVIVVAVWAVGGPFRPGWAKRAGTPRSLLASARSAPPPASSAPVAPPSPARAPSTASFPTLPFTALLSGTISQAGPDQDSGRVTITIATRLSGGAAGHLDLVLRGQAADGGVALRTSTVTFGPPSDPTAYRGQVTTLEGTQLAASVAKGNGQSLDLAINLQIDSSSGTVRGTLRTQAAGNGEGGQ